MINVLTRIPEPAQSTSFYRAIGPLQHLRTIMDLQWFEPQTYNWMSIGMADLAFIQRPFSQQDLQLVKFCKSLNLPVVIDYDDNLLEVPPWNPAYRHYESAKEVIKYTLSIADRVIVSTEALAQEFNQYRDDKVPCDVIENAFPSHLVSLDQYDHTPRQKVITWRGSNTHIKDIAIAYDAISAALETFPDWSLALLGEPPYEAIERFGSRVTVIPWQDPVIYLQTLKNLSPMIHIVPLIDDTFNRCKSNIAYLEGIYAGAQVIAPEWPEWDFPGCWTYDPQISFEDRLLWLMGRGTDYDHETAFSYVANNLTLDQINPKRKDLFGSLV